MAYDDDDRGGVSIEESDREIEDAICLNVATSVADQITEAMLKGASLPLSPSQIAGRAAEAAFVAMTRFRTLCREPDGD